MSLVHIFMLMRGLVFHPSKSSAENFCFFFILGKVLVLQQHQEIGTDARILPTTYIWMVLLVWESIVGHFLQNWMDII